MTNGSDEVGPIGGAIFTYLIAVIVPIFLNAPVIGNTSSANNQMASISETLTTIVYPWEHTSATILATAVGLVALYLQKRNS